ncbi:MAG: hypothetical protein KDK91_01235 [Gammaproteobacteria bacterium]|nr:hypothetical protein [Gammaproteobacteria bacterium]
MTAPHLDPAARSVDPESVDPASPAAATISIGGAYRFFLPLIFMTELNMISKSVIHAFLARADNPSVALAGFNVSFAFYYTVMSATELTMLVSISYLRSRAALKRIFLFLVLLLSPPFAFAMCVALTPLGDWVYGGIFGASDAVVREARLATLILGFSLPPLILRGVSFALLMLNKRTTFITAATAVRLASLAGALFVLPAFLEGAAAGAAALTLCMTFEGVFAFIFAWRHLRELPETDRAVDADTPRAGGRAAEGTPSMRRLWRFSWPLALNQVSEPGVLVIINLFLGFLANTDLALAAFGVTHGLVSLMFAPLRNLVQTGQTLTRSREDARVLLRFALQLVVGFTVLSIVLFHTGLSHTVLAGIMGLNPELEAYVQPAMEIGFLMSLFWGLGALFRGWMAGARSTGTLALTGGLRLSTSALVVGVAAFHPDLNGAVLGLCAWIMAYVVESIVLGLRLRSGVHLDRLGA